MQVLFIQGAGDGAYDADAKLAESLRTQLGADYDVLYPAMPDEGNPRYDTWKGPIAEQIDGLEEPAVLVGHSNGASILLKYLSETTIEKRIAGLFIVAAPFWGGDGWRYDGYEEVELPSDMANRLPKGAPVFLYQCKDDEIAPFEHLALYTALLPQATVREVEQGGHQFNDDLSVVARDIQGLAK